MNSDRLIRITALVPIESLDFSRCKAHPTSDSYEFCGVPVTERGYDVDLDVTYNGLSVEIDDGYYEDACDYVIEQQRSEWTDHGIGPDPYLSGGGIEINGEYRRIIL